VDFKSWATDAVCDIGTASWRSRMIGTWNTRCLWHRTWHVIESTGFTQPAIQLRECAHHTWKLANIAMVAGCCIHSERIGSSVTGNASSIVLVSAWQTRGRILAYRHIGRQIGIWYLNGVDRPYEARQAAEHHQKRDTARVMRRGAPSLQHTEGGRHGQNNGHDHSRNKLVWSIRTLVCVCVSVCIHACV